jgi:hypothetical protein
MTMKHIKSILAALVVAVLAVTALPAIDVSSGMPPFVSVYGGATRSQSTIQLGTNPRDQASISIPATAACNISQGEVVVLAGTTYPISVSKTTTAGDPAAFGIALETVTFGNQAQIAIGGIVRGKVAQSITVGDKLITSATAGTLTKSATVAEAAFTGLSGTAIVGRALETKTYSASTPYVLMQILGR